MSRVEKQNAEAARQSERAQKQINQKTQNAKTSSENKQKFGSMLKRQGEAKAKEESQNARQQAEGKGPQKGKVGNQARLAQMARGGGQHTARMMQQTKGFEGAMSRAKGGAEKETVANDGARNSGLKDAKVGSEERRSDVEGRTEAKKEAEAEQTKEDLKAEGRVNAAISGAGGKKGGGAGADSDGGQNESQAQELAMKAAKNAGGAQAAQEAKGTQKAGRIPDEIMDKLVKAIFVGVNGEGLKEFQIDLKDGALAGATVKVTAGADGRITLAFENVDKQTKNLLDASKGDLMRRFEDKGLHLGTMRVTAKK